MKSKAMKQLETELKAKKAEAEALKNKDGITAEELLNVTKELQTIQAKIKVQESLDADKDFDESGEEIKDTDPVNKPLYAEAKSHKGPFNSFGEQMLAIVKSSAKGAPIDSRLLEIQNASGANESIPSEGGFLVQQDFAGEIAKTVFETGVLISRCKKAVISANSNGLTMNGVDEKSRANGARWGGVQAYWPDEAATVTATKPKFRQIKLSLNKLMALYYSTDELLADAVALDSVLKQAFTEEIQFKVDDAIIRGNGAGKPLGILNSGALITQDKESGQVADTIIFENVSKMWTRMLAKSRPNSIWLINQEIEPQLESMYLAIGTSGIPVYMPANGISGSPYATLKSRPVIPIEQCSALGDVGDIILADMSQYLLADKNGMQMASSMHVLFLYDEQAFRITYRVDGQPFRDSAITPYKGANTLSSFVTLQAR